MPTKTGENYFKNQKNLREKKKKKKKKKKKPMETSPKNLKTCGHA